ncbi:tetratricopeptide repeat protein [Chryseobacterium sp. POL2]|uniref:tetratricopeptide repeat-containing sensor histidine kinase n=1 Tax=Chryseobacterium sp. POL2 TaxID=2713414 RepID=UPI0013E17EEC|nr:tetratricopeptide repeat-containing sensor histidine kinase [Chryseobacterium sp. POL2]QIG89986.1 tetratricopeptide repeat protein [Chryseobacterium sp. POL2]
MKSKFIFFTLVLLIINSCEKSSPETISRREDNHFYIKAWEVLDQGKKDSTYYYLNEAKDLAMRENDSVGVVKSLVNMAIIQEEESDNYGSLETSLSALPYFKESDTAQHRFLASNYNNLGVVSNSLKDYNNAIKFYNKALLFSDDEDEKLMLESNLANTYFNQKKYQEALDIYSNLLKEVPKDDDIYARILMNFARTQSYLDARFNPRGLFDKALKISESTNNDWALDAGYSYLSDYYLYKNKDSAYYFAQLMHKKSKILDAPQDRMEALQKMIKVGSPSTAQAYFEEFHRIDDSLHLATTLSKNQFALIRYESEKSKLENEQLKLENIKKEYRIRKQQYLTGGFIFISISILGITYFRLKRKRLKLKLEAENLIKTNKLTTYKKVHDVVANGLYRVMKEIENKEDLDKNSILYKLEEMYEKSRNISYDEKILEDKSFHDKLSEMISSFDNENIQIFIVGNSEELWECFSKEAQTHIFMVIQELLVNMRKHSNASRVVLKFDNETKYVNIRYKDNGVGLQDNQPKNGLKNTVNRIAVMHGKINFESSKNEGLKVNLEIPHQS